MSITNANFGLLVPLLAKADQVENTSDFLLKGLELVQQESETIQWFAIKYASTPNSFAIIDAFATQSGQSAHLAGPVADALRANAGELLSVVSDIAQFKVLASTVKPGADAAGALKLGLKARLVPKAGQEQALKDFLLTAVPLVEAELETPLWYAIEFPLSGEFGIVDFFKDEGGRDKHLNGKVAEALFENAETLLGRAPEIEKFDVLAAKVVL